MIISEVDGRPIFAAPIPGATICQVTSLRYWNPVFFSTCTVQGAIFGNISGVLIRIVENFEIPVDFEKKEQVEYRGPDGILSPSTHRSRSMANESEIYKKSPLGLRDDFSR